MKISRVKIALCIVLLAASMGGCANTKDFKAQGVAFDWSQTEKKVLIVQPDVTLGELTAGGMVEPRADWTQSARTYLASNLQSFMSKKGVATVPLDNLTDAHEIQLAKLHSAVGGAILIHAYGPLKLPTKTTALDWTLGPGTQVMRDRYGADYAMFLYVYDTYTSAGRGAVIAGSVVLCAFTGICPAVQGGSQVAFVSLVDLRTGNIVWFNLLSSASGDLRDDKDAGKFVDTILKDMPL